MKEGLAKGWKALARSRRVGALETARGRLQSLSPGDRLIALALAALVIIGSIVALLALERRFLVPTPAYGGSLTEGEVGSPRFVNPLLAISDADRDLTALTYAGLMGVGKDGALVPVLAEKYEVSADGKVYTFTLRADARFSDGTAVTAEDVVFTVEKAQDPGLKSPEYADWAGIAAEAVDARTVRFTLGKPYAPFLEDTTLGILPAHLWGGISDEQFPFSTLAVEPVGAGPFKVGKIARDASGLIESYRLVASSNYAPGRPYLDQITFLFFPREESLAAALGNGKVESAYGLTGGGSSSSVLTAPYSRVFGVFFNPDENKVFARLEVRKALSLAVDRAKIVDDVLGGYATALSGPLPPGPEAVATDGPADPVAAGAAVLTSAGWKYHGAARQWENATAKLSLGALTIRTSNVPELKAVATAVKEDWEKLGIAVSIELYEPGDLNQNVIRPRSYEALLFGEVVGRSQDLYAFWDSAQRSDPGLNIALYANKTVDALLEEARQTPDAGKRAEDLKKLGAAIAADYPAAFTHAPDFVYTVPKDLAGVALPEITTPSDRFATAAGWYRRVDYVWPFLATGTIFANVTY